MAEPRRLSLVDRLGLPVPEASGVVVARRIDGDIGIGRDGSLWLPSDKSAAVAGLDLTAGLPSGGGVISSFDLLHALPAGTPKPEGFAMVDDRTLLVALDTDKPRRNATLVRRSTPDGSD